MSKPFNVGPLLVWTTLRPVQRDCDQLRCALAKLAEDDPTFSADEEDIDGEIIVRATGELHLEIICARLLREHHIHVKSRGPKIIYLETVRATSAAEGKFITQSGRGHYAHVVIRIDPTPAKVTNSQTRRLSQPFQKDSSIRLSEEFDMHSRQGCRGLRDLLT